MIRGLLFDGGRTILLYFSTTTRLFDNVDDRFEMLTNAQRITAFVDARTTKLSRVDEAEDDHYRRLVTREPLKRAERAQQNADRKETESEQHPTEAEGEGANTSVSLN